MKLDRIILVSMFFCLIFVVFCGKLNLKNPSVEDLDKIKVFCWGDASFEETDSVFMGKQWSLCDLGDVKYQMADLNGNNIEEEYILEKGRLTVLENKDLIWQSSEDWQVDHFVLADSNNDGTVDINLSLWKRGNFGDAMPFWIEENDMSLKNHFFIFNLQDKNIKPVWQSSNLDNPNCQFFIEDINGDNENELVVLEGEYIDDSSSCSGKYFAVWKWDEWGFWNEWRSEEGLFDRIGVCDLPDSKCIVEF